MEKYKKPKCECGTILKIWQQEIWNCVHSIDSNGNVGNMVKMRTMWDGDMDCFRYLICPKCNNMYYADEDELGRIVCGKKRD